MLEKRYDIVIIGGGAAGLLAAGNLAKSKSSILVIEKMDKAGRKLMITGKGRCNITNMAPQSEFLKHVYPNGRYLKHAFSTFFNGDIQQFFEANGVEVEVERGNRLFPKSGKSIDVVDALCKFANQANVHFLYKAQVTKLHKVEDRVTAITVDTEKGLVQVSADRFLLCTGGKSYPATGTTGDGYPLAQSVGHTVTPTFQSLVPLVVKESEPTILQGLSLRNTKAIVWSNGKKVSEAFGELLFMRFGLSGPIILTLSRTVVQLLNQNKKVSLSLNMKPALDEPTLDNRLQRDINANGKMKLEELARKWMPHNLIAPFFNRLSLDTQKLGNQISGKERKRVRALLQHFEFTITGCRSFKEAIITAGGIDTAEVDRKTMKSKLIDNLWFAGEVLDLDADTGGYNLQIAWSTAYLAALSMKE